MQTAFVIGPYGQISVEIPETWSWTASAVDEEGILSDGLYGIVLKPTNAKNGQVELSYIDNMGLCGTGMTQEELTLSGIQTLKISYDDMPGWNMFMFQNEYEHVCAISRETEGWTDEMQNELLQVLDSVSFDKTKAAGEVGQYIPLQD